MSADSSNMPLAERKGLFATTQWSVVLAAGDIAPPSGVASDGKRLSL